MDDQQARAFFLYALGFALAIAALTGLLVAIARIMDSRW